MKNYVVSVKVELNQTVIIEDYEIAANDAAEAAELVANGQGCYIGETIEEYGEAVQEDVIHVEEYGDDDVSELEASAHTFEFDWSEETCEKKR